MRSRLFYTLTISLLLLPLFAAQYTGIVFSASSLTDLSASPDASITIEGPADANKNQEVTYIINYNDVLPTGGVLYILNAGFEIASVNPEPNTNSGSLIWTHDMIGSSGTITIMGQQTDCSTPTISVTHQASIFDIYASDPVPSESDSIETQVQCNERPTVSNVRISPTSEVAGEFVVPDAETDIKVSYDYSDPEKDDEGQTEIRWTRDGLSQAAFNDQVTIPSDETYAEEKWCVTVTPHDGQVYGERSQESCAYIERIPNELPEALEVTIEPEYPENLDDLVASYVYSDTNNDPEDTSQIEYRWYREGTFQPTLNNKPSIPASETNIGEVWCVTVRPHDGKEHGLESELACTIINPPGNRLPSADSPVITPTEPINNEPLTLRYNYTDPNDHPEKGSQIQWVRNGLIQSGLDDQPTISAEFTNAGEEWKAVIRPKDDYDYGGGPEYFGAPVESDNVLISAEFNTAPEARDPQIIPAGPGPDDRLRLTYQFVDAERDIESGSTIQWYRNGTYISEYDGRTVIPPDATIVGEEWSAKVTPNDGQDAGDEVEVLAVSILDQRQNIRPRALVPYLSRGIPGVQEELNLNYEYYDADGDPQGNTQIGWTVDGITNTLYNGMTLISPNETQIGQNWCATVTPHDGQVSGEQVPVTRCITIEEVGRNTKPEARNESITERPSSTDNLELDYEYFDLDNDPERGTSINWTVDGKLVDTFSGLTVIPGTQTSAGETWQATIRPNDNYDFGAEVVLSTTINIPPTLPNVQLAGDPALNQPLKPYYEYNDANGDALDHLRTRWHKNGEHQPQYDEQTTIPATDTTCEDERWYVVVAAHDGYEYGPDVTSNEVTIDCPNRYYLPFVAHFSEMP